MVICGWWSAGGGPRVGSWLARWVGGLVGGLLGGPGGACISWGTKCNTDKFIARPIDFFLASRCFSTRRWPELLATEISLLSA